jgi:Transport and Golgi organisation 2
MCTVSYIPANGGYYLTSNRDEKYTRATALAPAEYFFKNTKLIFPKDPNAGGTWIILKENGDSLCILNGAFTNFKATENHTKSRGQIVLEISVKENLLDSFLHINLYNTAPFTLILVNNLKLYECRWDGNEKYCSVLNNSIPHIWSSATLYTPTQQLERQSWFKHFIKNNPCPTQADITAFHTNTGTGNIETNLVMNRNNEYYTVSITSIQNNITEFNMQYQDLTTSQITINTLANKYALK